MCLLFKRRWSIKGLKIFLGGIIVILFIFQSVPYSVMLNWLGVVRMPDPVFMLKFVFDVLIG